MISEACDLFKQIPREKLDKLWKDNNNEVDLDFSFLGFENIYKAALLVAPKGMTIIDFGCAYATQSWYFRNHKQYIGVDIDKCYQLETDNSTYYRNISIQNFINNIFPTLSIEKSNVFAICSYVPDENARKMVKEEFPYCLVYYPEWSHKKNQHLLSVSKTKMENKIEGDDL